jgi:dTDP-glucose 4,6-dehydratase
MKRVLLTGAGGAIGAHVYVHIMRNTDWEVVALDSFHHKGYKERLDSFSVGHPDWLERLTILQHNLEGPITPPLKEAIGHIDYVLHLAAISDVQFSVDNPVFTMKNNIGSAITMLEYAREEKPEIFVYFSTDEIYGPIEGDNAHKEWDSHRPSNPYAASKAASEDLCYCYWRAYDVPLIITNTMNNFGETQGASKFPAMIQNKLENGKKVTIHGNNKEIGSRFYIHSRNVADALLFILSKGAHHHAQGTIDEPHKYHIVGDKRLNNLELAQMIAKLMGKELDYEIVDFHKFNLGHDIHYGMVDTKLKALGWTSPLTLEESMKGTIEWQKKHPEWI